MSEPELAAARLRELDLIALRREVSRWQNAFAGSMGAHARSHAAHIHQIIDELTVLKRDLRKHGEGSAKAQVPRELARLNAAWPAWLMTELPPPPALRTVLVATSKELRDALHDARPGDELILADGVWSLADFTHGIELAGTPVRPIVIRSQSVGQAIMIGDATDTLTARHVVFRDLTFLDVGSEFTGRPVVFAGENVRLAQCVFYSRMPTSGFVFRADRLRFDRNYVAGRYIKSAIAIEGDGSKLDGNYFGWRIAGGAGSNTSTVNIAHSAKHTRIKSNLFCGIGASFIDSGYATTVEDNTFQNIPGPALTIEQASRQSVVRENMAFDVGKIELLSVEIRFLNNYLEHAGISAAGAGIYTNNTLIVSEDSSEEPHAVPTAWKPGQLNLVCTESQMIWPARPGIAEVAFQGESEEFQAPTLMRDVLGFLRPHQRYGRLGFQAEKLPLGRASEVGPTWLPTELSVNRPLTQWHQSNDQSVWPSIRTLEPNSGDKDLAVEVDGEVIQLSNAVRNVGVESAELTSVQSWTLQGWISVADVPPAGCVLAKANRGADHWELSLTDDQRLVLSGEVMGSDWSFSTESDFGELDFKNSGNVSFFALVAERTNAGWEICFYRGNKVESVDLVAAETVPLNAFLDVTVVEFVRSNAGGPGLISAKLFVAPDVSSEQSISQLGILNVSDLESLRIGDVIGK
ncbi:MAG: hypothetical protein MPJ50_06665 [Pirellulales bacterium]|nr:hypothetical protein [Pirellulales bacterium]